MIRLEKKYIINNDYERLRFLKFIFKKGFRNIYKDRINFSIYLDYKNLKFFHDSEEGLSFRNKLRLRVEKKFFINNYKELKFDNLHVSVGWFDYSISCGQPGFEERENMKNSLDVASKSGFTCIGIQPNTDPVIDKRSEIEYLKLLSANNIVTAHPIGSLTKKSEGNKFVDREGALLRGRIQ